ncbi:hypothetical protein [Devosia sp. A369]
MVKPKSAELRRSIDVELPAIKRLPALASLDAEMQIQVVTMLAIVAQRPGVYQRDMDGHVGVSQSSVSRNVHILSRCRRDGTPGFGLVEQRPDARDVRSQRLCLTAAGVTFVSRLIDQSAAVAQTETLPAPARG